MAQNGTCTKFQYMEVPNLEYVDHIRSLLSDLHFWHFLTVSNARNLKLNNSSHGYGKSSNRPAFDGPQFDGPQWTKEISPLRPFIPAGINSFLVLFVLTISLRFHTFLLTFGQQMAIELVPIPLPASADASRLANFGREVKGIDPAAITPGSELLKEIESALYTVGLEIKRFSLAEFLCSLIFELHELQHGVLLFRDIKLTPAQQYAITKVCAHHSWLYLL